MTTFKIFKISCPIILSHARTHARNTHARLYYYLLMFLKLLYQCQTVRFARLIWVYTVCSALSILIKKIMREGHLSGRQKTFLQTCAPCEDSDQPAHSRIFDSQKCSFFKRTKKTLTAWVCRLIGFFVWCTCKKVRFLTLRLICMKCQILFSGNDKTRMRTRWRPIANPNAHC